MLQTLSMNPLYPIIENSVFGATKLWRSNFASEIHFASELHFGDSLRRSFTSEIHFASELHFGDSLRFGASLRRFASLRSFTSEIHFASELHFGTQCGEIALLGFHTLRHER